MAETQAASRPWTLQDYQDAFNDPDSFFSEFFVTSGDATLIAFYVLAIGALIGVIGASVGLRRFLRT